MKHFLGVLAILLAAAMTHAQLNNQQPAVPAFHASAPAPTEKLPPILTQKELADQGFIEPARVEAYKAAAKASKVLYQMPCYCFCDRNHGHASLRSCFEGTHGANCGTCMQEALYTYRQSQKGQPARLIREGILRGDYKLIDLQNVAPVK
jgi:Protein of unknown function with PCYCGC motif